MLLFSITLINAKPWAYELNSNFENKPEWTLCHFMNSDLNKQAQALEVTFSRKTIITHKPVSTILRIYLKGALNKFLSSMKKSVSYIYYIHINGTLDEILICILIFISDYIIWILCIQKPEFGFQNNRNLLELKI